MRIGDDIVFKILEIMITDYKLGLTKTFYVSNAVKIIDGSDLKTHCIFWGTTIKTIKATSPKHQWFIEFFRVKSESSNVFLE